MKNKSIADLVAGDMASIMENDDYKAIFSKPLAPKTAAKKDDEKKDKKKPKHNHPNFDKCLKNCPAFKFKKSADINDTMAVLAQASEVLDNYGLTKSATMVLSGMSVLAEEIDKMCANDEKDDKPSEEDDDDFVEVDNDDHDDADKKQWYHMEVGGGGEDAGEELRSLLKNLNLSSNESDESENDKDHNSKPIDEDFDVDYEDTYSLPKDASFRNEIIKVIAAKAKPKGEFIFPKDHPKVKSGDHFPINSENRGRSAIQMMMKYKSAPPWYSGSLESLKSSIIRAVKKKYPGIDVKEKA